MLSSTQMHCRLALAAALITAGIALGAAIANETPTGTVKGKVTARDSGNAVSAWVDLTSKFRLDGQTLRFGTRSAKDGTFSFSRVPAGLYSLSIHGRAHHLKPATILVAEAKTQEIEAELEPEQPSLTLYVHQHMFLPDERARITCSGFVTTTDTVSFSIYKVDEKRLLGQFGGSIYDLVGVNRYDAATNRRVDPSSNPALSLAASFKSPIKTRDSEGVFTERFLLPALQPGIYVVRARADESQDIDWLLVTRIGLVTKSTGRQLLAYTVDLKTGKPAAGADVEVFSDGNRVGKGTAGPDGLARVATARAEGRSRIVARKGDSFAFVDTWAQDEDAGGDTVYCYTDRPVYRPGQKVYFRGIARRMQNGRYVTEPNRQVEVEVRDSRDNLVYRDTKRTDGFGSYHGEMNLNSESATGYYSIVSTVEGAERGSESGFRVMAYRKPEFSVKVAFDKKRYLRGETVRARITAQYYFGAPVANARVSFNVSRSPFWLFEEDEEFYSDFSDFGGYGESVKWGETRTDENGEAVVEFRANWPRPSKDDPYDTDQMFSLDCYVTDRSDQEADGEGSVLATRGEFAVSVTPDKYCAKAGSRVTADVTVKYHNRKPVKNQEVRVVVGRHFWRPDGSYEFRTIRRETVTTDSSGRASVSFKASEGDLEITATATDRRGNDVSGTGYVWCWSGAGAEIEGARYSDLRIVMDKKTYAAGDTARVLINTASPGATALLTVESDRVHLARAVPLTGKSTTVELPVKSDYKPNFYVVVCFVKDKRFFRSDARAKVSLAEEKLKIEVLPNRSKYRPGEQAVYRLRATDSSGRPAVAQLSVGVVDEAIYAIAEDETTPILYYFYSRKPNNVATGFSFPEIYLSDPDKAGSARLNAEPRMRKRFKDTAYWSPSVVTAANGEAQVRFRMPDNLTTWRATVRGITAGTACGQAVRKVLAQQPLLVRLEAPRFLVQNDTACVTASVHNYTGKTQRVRVRLTARGPGLNQSRRQEITVADGGIERLDWTLSVPKPGDLALSAAAKGESAGDAMQVTLPVYPHGEERRWLKAGAITSQPGVSETVQVRGDAIPEATKLSIRLAPSLAASMLGSLDYLARYPYGCTEQTTSAFLPDVVISRSFKGAGVMSHRLEKQLPDMVTRGLYRLYRFQLENGGWAWGEYGEANIWMTAYVCYGLMLARDAGFPVNPNVLERGTDALAALARSVKKPNEDTDFAHYVLALAGADVSDYFLARLERNVPAPARPFYPGVRRFPARERTAPPAGLTNTGLAYAAMALSRNGLPEQARLALQMLLARANRQPGLMYWTAQRPYAWEGDHVETTAIALQALLLLSPNYSEAADVVRWLMRQRTGNYWHSTRQTAQVLIAMAEYLKRTGELAPDYTVSVKVNGILAGSFRMDRKSVFDVERVVDAAPGLVRKGRNSVQISKSGRGNLYYTLEMTQFIARDKIPARITGSGFTVTRSYHKSTAPIQASLREKPGPEVNRLRVGEVALVRLVIDSSRPLRYLMLEDYIPAGCEIVDKGEIDYYEWDFWYCDRDIRDNRAAFFMDTVPAGRHVIEYRMRAGFAGTYHAPPAQLFGMYQPDLRACTAETEFVVR